MTASTLGAGALTIGEAERRSGVPKETLRVWERRYGFPAPARDAAGDRLYTVADVEKLRLMKSLIDAGERPAQLAALTVEALAARAPRPTPANDAVGEWVEAALDRLRRHDVDGLRDILQAGIYAQGLGRFVQDNVAALIRAVGEAWVGGRLQVYEEHLFTEQLVRVLRGALDGLPRPATARPRVLLTTAPGEPHALGLLMAECLLTLGGARCLSLGPETPLEQIVGAASAHAAEVVALSFSGMFGEAAARAVALDLRAQLPPGTELWVGGACSGLSALRQDGVRPLVNLADIPDALDHWRVVAGKDR